MDTVFHNITENGRFYEKYRPGVNYLRLTEKLLITFPIIFQRGGFHNEPDRKILFFIKEESGIPLSLWESR